MAETMKVTAEDGNTYEFGEKAKVKKQSSIRDDGTVVTKFVFKNGVVRTHETPSDSSVYSRLAAHGADQKFGDEFAGLEDVEDCIEAFDEMSKRLTRGEWSEKRTSDGLAGSSLLARALVKTTGLTLEAVKERLSKLDPKTKLALSKGSEVAAEINRIKAERDAKKPAKDAVDPNEALAAFLG
jgi:hypothetical protein